MQPRSTCRLHLALPIGGGGCVAELERGLVAQSTLSSSPLRGRASLPRSPLRATPGSLPPAIFLVIVVPYLPECYPLSHLPTKIREVRHIHQFLLTKKGGPHTNTVGTEVGRLLEHPHPKHPAPRPTLLLERGHKFAPPCPLQAWVFSLKVRSLSQSKNGISFLFAFFMVKFELFSLTVKTENLYLLRIFFQFVVCHLILALSLNFKNPIFRSSVDKFLKFLPL